MSVQQGSRKQCIGNDLDDLEEPNLEHNIKLQNYYNSINIISDEFILPLNIDDESDTEYNEVGVDDNNSDNEQSDIDSDTNYDNFEENQE